MSSTPTQIAARITLGFNIGNTLEAMMGETSWGNPKITNELIVKAKSSGFDAIRLPVSWNQYANQTTAKIDPAWLDRVKQVVKYCVDNDLYVIVNIHWDGGWLENNVKADKQVANNAKQRAFWQQIATHLREFDERVIFASANEPDVETAAEMAVLMSYHQTFVDAVRATGGRNAHRVLLVQGPDTDFDKTTRLWTGMPKDTVSDKLMFEAHFYTPFGFALQEKDESWGRMFYYWGLPNLSTTDTDRNPTYGNEAEIDQLMTSMKTKFIDKGIPVIIGEFGAMRRDNLTGDSLARHLASRTYYLEYVTRAMVKNGLTPFLWDTGTIIDRRTLAIGDEPALTAIKKGAGKP